MTGRDSDGPRPFEQAVHALASRQHGVVTRGQLLDAGIGPDVVDRRLKAGRLRRIHRGVYQAGPVSAPRAEEIAAALACGRSAVVSHRSAAVLWKLLPGTGSPGVVEVTVRQGHPRSRRGMRIHRVRTLRGDEVMELDGIPVTTPARTLYDVAASATPRELERALAEAYALRLATHAELRALLVRHRGRRGSRCLQAVLEGGHPALTRSEAEERFLELTRKAQVDEPEVNVRVAGHEVDFLWRTERLVVEIDGFAFHSSSWAFERDRRRDAALTAAGYRVVRVTWRQIEDEGEAVLVRLAMALALAGRG